MRPFFAALLVLHGAIHLLGPAKAFGWADISQLRAPIGPPAGFLWLLATVLFMVAALGVGLSAPWWWYAALPGVLLSQALIVSTWHDARFGTVANVIIVIPVLLAALDHRSASFQSRFARDRTALLALQRRESATVTDADLAELPSLMQQYLRRAGVVGRPRVRNMRIRFTAQMRSGPTSRWMRATATQYEFFDRPARLFHMRASLLGIPFDVYHRYVDGAATFQVKVAGVFPMVNKQGSGLTHDETVTLMNDVLVMAPAAVLELPFSFQPAGDRTVHATMVNAGYSVSADLTFDEAGDLVGFVSSDRAHDREGGAAVWSTPISDYREIDGVRVGAHGDANWIDASGEWTYGRFQIVSIAYNVAR